MLNNLMNPDTPVTMEEADKAFVKYPYFALPQIKALDSVSNPEERETLRRRIAMTAGDETAAHRLVGAIPEEFNSFYPDMTPPALSTSDTIDTFLSKYGKSTPAANEEIPIAPPAIDYASTFLERDESEGTPADSTTSIIDSFLKTTDSTPREKSAPKESGATALTESLARVMIKNHNYRKALEIIMELNLKNPEKNIYFADQIRFLKKLIINESKS